MKRNYSLLSAFEVENFNFVESRKKKPNYNLSFPFALHRKPEKVEGLGVCLLMSSRDGIDEMFIYPNLKVCLFSNIFCLRCKFFHLSQMSSSFQSN